MLPARALAVLTLVAFLPPGALAEEARCRDDRGASPTGDWPSAADAVRAARPAEAAALDAYAFTLDGPDAARRGLRTDGLVIVHRGVVTYERYGRGFGPASRHLAWSVAKAATNALAGVAALRGAVTEDDSLCRHLAAAGPAHCKVALRDLLDSASGLDWTESYEHRALQTSSVLAMLYGEGRRDMAAFVLTHAQAATPGSAWRYSSGDAVLLAAAVDRAMVRSGAAPGWPSELLFQPLGMSSAVLERDAAGTLVGSSYLYATPRDLARLGWLYLQDGCWRGKALLPAGWVAASTQPSRPFRAPGGARRARDGAMGRGFWTNRPAPEVGLAGPPWPGAPEDAYAARGHWGQEVVVIPSERMVIVRTADDREPGVLDLGKLIALSIAAGRLP